jgi:predicted DCC family thiol-disulfide oxidoreductase YuxK
MLHGEFGALSIVLLKEAWKTFMIARLLQYSAAIPPTHLSLKDQPFRSIVVRGSSDMPNLELAGNSQAWVLYDNQCGFCSRWIEFWRTTLAKRNIGIAGLQERWVVERLGLAEQELLHDIRLLTTEGLIVSGADVYLYVTRRIWWARPFYSIFCLPGFNQLLHLGYGWFARNRHRISTTCGLQPAPASKPDATAFGNSRK